MVTQEGVNFVLMIFTNKLKDDRKFKVRKQTQISRDKNQEYVSPFTGILNIDEREGEETLLNGLESFDQIWITSATQGNSNP